MTTNSGLPKSVHRDPSSYAGELLAKGDWPETDHDALIVLGCLVCESARLPAVSLITRQWVQACFAHGVDVDNFCWGYINDASQRLLLQCGADGNFMPKSDDECEWACVRSHTFWWSLDPAYTLARCRLVDAGLLECPPPCNCVRARSTPLMVRTSAEVQASFRLAWRTVLGAHFPTVLVAVVSDYVFRYPTWSPK